MKIKAKAKFWDVRFSRPEKRGWLQSDGSFKEYTHDSNVHVMVAAESAAKVTELVMAEYPTATIHQINHRGGECAIIVQAELLG
ncbi:MAG: hypothetical protein ACK6A7_17150 [Planctomycetota bacterium]